MPLYLLVAGHLFLLCALPPKVKSAVVGWAVVFTALHLAAPWMVLLGGRALAWVYPLSGTGMLLGFTALLGVPIYEMWWASPARARD
jgi:hypothetical protein